ncbi:MAG: PadR family transcriptional regulator [Novosphingobium sp.]|jgi:DNA-binding PadR family transcriptional regulator|nr:PadR family transcriptional regulator [Brevundimonas sp.]
MFFAYSRHGCGKHAGGRWRGSRNWGPFMFQWDASSEDGARRTRRRMFDGGELRLVLLKLIADEPRHGYDLIKAIEELTGGAYAPSPGVVYPTLTLLADMDLIAEDAGESARRRFRITEAGSAHLAERAEEVAALMARLAAMKEARSRPDAASLRRAMGNLRQVLMDKVRAGEAGPEMIDEIVTAIDELARRIEKL